MAEYIHKLEEYKACRDCVVKNHTTCDVEEFVFNMHNFAQETKGEKMNADFKNCKVKEIAWRLALSVKENGITGVGK